MNLLDGALENDASYDRFLREFETGTLPKSQWTHAAHLAVAAHFLLTLPAREALSSMREALIHYNESTATPNNADNGYHETLTRFWMAISDAFLAQQTHPRPLDKVRALVEQYGSARDLWTEYYGFDLVRSREARRIWAAPDLQSLSGELR